MGEVGEQGAISRAVVISTRAEGWSRREKVTVLVTVADFRPGNAKELATVCRRKLFRKRRLRQAEGTGVEPATGKPAPDFE